MIDKAVILARGLGKRMRRSDQSAALDDTQSRIADSGVKAMIPIGRPFLDYVLNALVQAGFGPSSVLTTGAPHSAANRIACLR